MCDISVVFCGRTVEWETEESDSSVLDICKRFSSCSSSAALVPTQLPRVFSQGIKPARLGADRPLSSSVGFKIGRRCTYPFRYDFIIWWL